MHQPAEALNAATDEQLLTACLRGEAAAWDNLIDRYAGLIYSIPLKYGLSEADAADVFQSVCVTLLEKLGTVRAPRGLAAWIITTTSRQSLGVARHRRREHNRSIGEVFVVSDGALADVDPLPEEELLGLERQRIVRGAVRQLPTNCQRLIEALFSDGSEHETYQELAAHLGIPMNSVGPTRTRCLEKLRRLLLAAGFTP